MWEKDSVEKKLKKILRRNWDQCFGVCSSETHKSEDGRSSGVLLLLRAEHLEIDLHVHVCRTSTWHLTGEATPLGHKPTTSSNIAYSLPIKYLRFFFVPNRATNCWRYSSLMYFISFIPGTPQSLFFYFEIDLKYSAFLGFQTKQSS